MFPYSLEIPKSTKEFIPQLNILIKAHDCTYTSKGKNGMTSILLHFTSEQLRSAFIKELKAEFPAYAGLGTRLLQLR